MQSAPLVPYAITVLISSLFALGAYWAKRTDNRLVALEQKDAEASERLARVETMVLAMKSQLDRIEDKL